MKHFQSGFLFCSVETLPSYLYYILFIPYIYSLMFHYFLYGSPQVGVLIDEIEKELEIERKKAEAAMGDI